MEFTYFEIQLFFWFKKYTVARYFRKIVLNFPGYLPRFKFKYSM